MPESKLARVVLMQASPVSTLRIDKATQTRKHCTWQRIIHMNWLVFQTCSRLIDLQVTKVTAGST